MPSEAPGRVLPSPSSFRRLWVIPGWWAHGETSAFGSHGLVCAAVRGCPVQAPHPNRLRLRGLCFQMNSHPGVPGRCAFAGGNSTQDG